MKHCPACRRAYTEEALKFCAKDGTPLVAGAPGAPRDDDSAPTQILGGDGARAKADAPRAATAGVEAAPATSSLTTGRLGPGAGAKAGRRRTLAAVAALLAVCAGAALLALYLHARDTEAAVESVGVLPFENQTRDPEAEYLSDGLTESLIYRLSELPNLKVSPRSSVFRYKGRETDPLKAGAELGVNAVLSGRVAQRGDQIVVSAELVDVRHNELLWGERYDRKVSDLLALQREIAREIAGNLRPRLAGAEPGRAGRRYTDDPAAYQLYLKGRYYWNKRTDEGFDRAADYFRQAIDRDPTYALAYAGLADCYLLRLNEQRQHAPRVKEAAERALALDPTLAEAHTTLAFFKTLYERDWEGAREEFKEAIRLNPRYATARQWFAIYWAMQGDTEAALAEIDRAIELDPLSLIINADKGRILFSARRYDEAIRQLQETTRMDPSFGTARLILGWCYAEKGLYEQAEAELLKARELGVGESATLSRLAYVHARAGRRDEARRALEELRRRPEGSAISPYSLAAVYSALGERDRALGLLERALEERAAGQSFIKVDPIFDNLRPDPRFAALVRRAGLRP